MRYASLYSTALLVFAVQLPAGATQTATAMSSAPRAVGGSAAGTTRMQVTVPAPWAAQDPADSLYRMARAALNEGRFDRAAEVFSRIIERYPRSEYTPDAYYWKAYALYRAGGRTDLKTALKSLSEQRSRFPRARTRSDADELATRISGSLAQLGDAAEAEKIWKVAGGGSARAAASGGSSRSASRSSSGCAQDDDDIRVAALNAVLQMDAERAVPLLKQVMARRDSCSTALRRKAVFLISQKRTDETEDLLVSAVRNDPDPDVRQQAVFWLSQVPSEKSLAALQDLLRTSTDTEIQEKAIFALSQHNSRNAARVLRDYAERPDVPEKLRANAIFWIGQRNSAENAEYLRSLYAKLTNPELKEKVIFSVSQMHAAQNQEFLMGIALDTKESQQLRKQALFWAGQSGTVPVSQLAQLYDRMPDREMKEQLIFVLSQRNDTEAVDKLMDIARKETNVELRKKAIFWISQSKDPRVAEFLMDMINK